MTSYSVISSSDYGFGFVIILCFPFLRLIIKYNHGLQQFKLLLFATTAQKISKELQVKQFTTVPDTE